ncbi:hypothetical protein ZIOFF_039274 [Zingiber officinale]|uniref:Protein kinase domain-containing protein n=1 Tax=Zingiber officinale TaxID=94328 RepID=A0A8J5G306_ZINOF|nr:hypothetical protein ZIOFF_039274 [Zingiber officinale]
MVALGRGSKISPNGRTFPQGKRQNPKPKIGLALLEFRSRVEADPFGALENWNPSDRNPCNWNGVNCVDGKVFNLTLIEFSLQGTLSSDLGKLRHLRALNRFSGVIPKEIGGLTKLELLDLRNNKLTGTIPKEIVEMHSLKHLLLCHNKFQSRTSAEKSNKHADQIQDWNHSCDAADDLQPLNRKVGHRYILNNRRNFLPCFKCEHIFNDHQQRDGNQNADFCKTYIMMNTQIHYVPRRKLAEATKNLYANPVNGGPINQIVSVLTTTSGSFPALISKSRLNPSEAPIPLPNPQSVSPTAEPTKPAGNEIPSSESISTWTYILIISAAALLLTLAACIVLVCRRKDGANIGPWKTGLSGQLQKALVTGVPKLKRLELEAACEEFSNIVLSYPAFTVYKGILSSGVEIAVVSTTITSAKEWSKESEKLFRKKVEALSRINHKNFINLLGYCEEDEPFMRMMVLEYASNGSLYEHLHGEEFELLDWNARMRVIMGIAYCLQHIHELDPPIQHPNLRSRSILVTEDYAAKIVDISVWKEIIDQGKLGVKDYLNNYDTLYDPANNVYSFGVLLMEIVSGKVIQREEEGSILNLGDGGPSSFVDSNVKSHSEEEFRIVCEVIQDCTSSDPRNRPSMREVTSKLRKIIDISPEAAIPRLSPLWWAELEILSVEAS